MPRRTEPRPNRTGLEFLPYAAAFVFVAVIWQLKGSVDISKPGLFMAHPTHDADAPFTRAASLKKAAIQTDAELTVQKIAKNKQGGDPIKILLQDRGVNVSVSDIDAEIDNKLDAAMEGKLNISQTNDGNKKDNQEPNLVMDTNETVNPRSNQQNTTPPYIQNAKKPLNILIFYPDDWRHDTIGGVAPVVKTPFLNELASEGIRFTKNCVTTSICWISRATLFTGQYVNRHKSYRLLKPEFYKPWANESWPAHLQRRAGYWVGHVGKWQYSNPDKTVQKKLFNWTVIFEGKHTYGKTTAAEKTRDGVIEFLKKRPKDRPFAVTAAFYPPKAIGNSFEPGGQWFPKNETREKYYDHETIPTPYDLEESYKKMPKWFRRQERAGRSRFEERFEGAKFQAAMKNYYSLVTEVDMACRQITDKLKEEGILEETLVIFTTDNGLFHAEHGLGGKWYPYQESIRVPLIVRDPRMPKESVNTLDSHYTLNIDLAPTILRAAGLVPPPSMQGRDIADLYLPKPSPEEELAESQESEKLANYGGLEEYKWPTTTMMNASSTKLWREEFYYEFPLDMSNRMPMNTALVTGDLKYIVWPSVNYEQLFNLTEDPLEQNDVWSRTGHYGQVVKELKKRHDELKELYGTEKGMRRR